MTAPPFIYFLKPVGMDGPIKIGCSRTPMGRLKIMMAWSPVPLEIVLTVPGDIALENNIHDCFAETHSHSEWFHSSDRLWAAINEIKAGKSVEQAIDLSDKRGCLRGLESGAWTEARRRMMSLHQRTTHAIRRAANELGLPSDRDLREPYWVRDILDVARERPLTSKESHSFDQFTREPELHCEPAPERVRRATPQPAEAAAE